MAGGLPVVPAKVEKFHNSTNFYDAIEDALKSL